MTAVYITAIIAAMLVTITAITAIRDTAKAKHQPAQPCPNCGHNDKEKSA
ncbi:hypothetical protein [Streptomyces sp. FL07-04A]|nr:hypothetical protein [Streptomyces sp. FL07-04A]MDX3576005.1 hypothetical protein [Streptomyces sp. FL07-04A]